MAIILPANTLSAGGFSVDNSCRFNPGDSPELSRSTGDGNEDVGSFSFWWKPDKEGGATFYSIYVDSSNFFTISVDGGGNFQVLNKLSGSYNMQFESTATFRDPSAWYNFVVLVDTTQSTEANRMKAYVNGTQITSWQTSTYPSQNTDMIMNSNSRTAYISHSGDRMHGYLAEFVLIDGTAQAVTDFGEFDEDSPTIWKPKDVSGLSKGVNGFYLDFEDSSALGNCAFGGTDFTVSNLAAADQATDTPTNNFATLNPLYKGSLGATTFAEGNLKFHETNSPSESSPGASTIAVANGKWYFEVYCEEDEDHPPWIAASTVESAQTILTAAGTGHIWGLLASTHAVALYNDVVYKTSGGSYSEILTAGLTGGRAADGDIMKMALDLDNGKVWFGKNDEWTNGTASISSTLDASNNDTTVTAGVDHYLGCGGEGLICWANFGSPARTISSGNADANGYGNFEYAVPSGFYALCTKNVAEYG